MFESFLWFISAHTATNTDKIVAKASQWQSYKGPFINYLTCCLTLIWTTSFHMKWIFPFFSGLCERSLANYLTHQVLGPRGTPSGWTWGINSDTWKSLPPYGFWQKLLYMFFDRLEQTFIKIRPFDTFFLTQKSSFWK